MRWILAAALALALFHLSPIRDSVDRGFFDAASRRPFRAVPPPAGSALVLMDRNTMDALSQQGLGGTWPPPRATFAALIAGLERAGARRIVLDFIFLDHSAAAEQDALLGGLAAGVTQVVLARTPNQMPIFWDDTFTSAHPTLFQPSRTGLVAADADSDGVLRHYVAAHSLAAAALDEPRPGASGLLRWHGGLEQLRGSGGIVPILSAAPFVIAGLPIVSALAETVPDADPAALAAALHAQRKLTGPGFDAVRGRVVFVGANTEGTFDQKPFAIGGLEPGVLMHWTAWANLTGGGFIQACPAWLTPVVALLIMLLIAVAGVGGTRLVLPVLTAIVLACGALAAAYIGLSHGWYLPPSLPVAAASFGLLGVVAENFWRERRRRNEVQAMFGSYVAPEVVELLVRDPAAIRLGGERREATVFFCDLAGFTELSERVPPDQLLELVNGYLQQTSDCLMQQGGYIDKYIGDAVMAVFGAPKANPDHALAACWAALAAQRLMAERNPRLSVTHGQQLHMRIGINTGDMIIGNVGSERKKNYTVLGDAVNLASRLEGANKEFGTSILISDTTARRVADHLVVRPLTGLRVKGKHIAVPVFELIGEMAGIPPARREFLRVYAEAHALYTGQRFAEAAIAMERAASLAPDDRMTRLLLRESRLFAVQPPPVDWQPTLVLETK